MMKQQVMSAVQGQLGHIESVDAQELGAAVDIIKDLAEAEYYCSIVKAMEEKEHEPKYMMYYPSPYDYNRDMDRGQGRMYYDGGNNGGSSGNGGSSMGGRSGSRGYYEYPMVPEFAMRDYREGRSGSTRRTYMESKETHQPKEMKMKELEKYLHELSSDITEMIHDASPEEKTLLKQKLSTLSTKID